MASPPPHGLPGHLVDFVGALRRHQVPVGPGETVDAAAVLGALNLLHREQLREGLAAALLRRSGQRAVFDTLFDLYFPIALGRGRSEVEVPWTPDGAVDLEALRDILADLLRDGDDAALRELARAVVDALGQAGGSGQGGNGPGQQGQGPRNWSAYQVLRQLSPETLLARILSDLLAGTSEKDQAFAEEVARREIRQRIADFRKMITDEVRRRTAETRGRDQVAKTAVPKQAEQVEFLSAYAAPCAGRCPPAGCRCARPTARGARAARSWWCSATCPARWPGSATSPCYWCRHCASSSARCGCSPSWSAPTRSPTCSPRATTWPA